MQDKLKKLKEYLYSNKIAALIIHACLSGVVILSVALRFPRYQAHIQSTVLVKIVLCIIGFSVVSALVYIFLKRSVLQYKDSFSAWFAQQTMQTAALSLFAVIIVVLSGIFLILFPAVFSTKSGIPSTITASCRLIPDADSTITTIPQDIPVRIRSVTQGRHQLEIADSEFDELSIHFILRNSQVPKRFIFRSHNSGIVSAHIFSQEQPETGTCETIDFTLSKEHVVHGRELTAYVVPIHQTTPLSHLTVTIRRDRTLSDFPYPFQIHDIGLYATEKGPLYDNRPLVSMIPQKLFGTIVSVTVVFLTALGLLLTFVIKDRKFLRILIPVFVFVLAITVVVLEIWSMFPSNVATRDLWYLVSEVCLQGVGANLNYGLYMGIKLLTGEGLTTYWNRMPGYGLLCALTAFFLDNPADLVRLCLTMIVVHIVSFATAASFLVWSLMKIMNRKTALCITSFICFSPNQLFYTQVDSIMISIAMIIFGATALFLHMKKSGDSVPLKYHILLHSSFALWFACRPDIVPGWALVSIVLYWRSWRYLLIPLTLYLFIGVNWGMYKVSRGEDFIMTTTSVGASAFVGLWEVPNKFAWDASDAGYYRFAFSNNLATSSKDTSDYVVSEVARFCFTYPVYAAVLVWHKFLDFIFYYSWPGKFSLSIQYALKGFWLLLGCSLWLIAVMVLSFIYRYKRYQVFLLGWPVFCNVPLFFIMFSSGGRFYAPGSAALLICALPLVCENDFYQRIRIRPKPALVVLAITFVVYVLGEPLYDLLLTWDSARYWAPFLDPNVSPFNVFK